MPAARPSATRPRRSASRSFGATRRRSTSPFAGAIDLIYIDGGHTYEYVKSDTENALELLSPTGTIVWDDYGSHPGVYELVTALAATLDKPVYHVFGSRMAIYSRQDFVVRRPFAHHASLPG